MASVKQVCRVCGKTYEACHTAKKNVGEFRWQEVACSPECGAEYLRRVMAARAKPVQPQTVQHRRVRREPVAEVEATPVIAEAETVE